uniref:Inositol 1,4,5-triphosphate receptor-interacting protein-like protein n=1 Tax=Callorhinchus milii TaxID=7868 RepID=V9KKZ9_CALMI
MPGLLGVASVCLLVITGSMYHPRLLSDEVEYEEVLVKMQEQEQQYKLEMERLQKAVDVESRHDSQMKGNAMVKGEKRTHLNWNTWNILLMVTILFLELWRQDTRQDNIPECNSEEEDENEAPQRLYCNILNIPERPVLDDFYKCVKEANREPPQTCEFVEAFVDNLLQACRNMCQWNSETIVEDCIGIGSQFEKWGCKTPSVYDVLAPILIQDGYTFKPEICCCDIPSDKQSYGRILMISPGNEEVSCVCKSSELDGEVLCLIHSKKFERELQHTNALASIVCSEWYLDSKKVLKWFRTAFIRAWSEVCHKYDFELSFHNITGSCGLKLQYQSGRNIYIKVFPAVRLKESDVFLVANFPDCTKDSTLASTYWHLSCAVCELRFLKIITKSLPKNSCHLKCLQILTFLNEKLYSSTEKKSVLTSYFFKTVLMHLLLSQPYMNWHDRCLEQRLQDVLKFLGKSLDEKRLHRFMIGNRAFPKQFGIPELLLQAEPINLLRSFVLQRDVYSQALMEYQKLLRDMGPSMTECIKG